MSLVLLGIYDQAMLSTLSVGSSSADEIRHIIRIVVEGIGERALDRTDKPSNSLFLPQFQTENRSHFSWNCSKACRNPAFGRLQAAGYGTCVMLPLPLTCDRRMVGCP